MTRPGTTCLEGAASNFCWKGQMKVKRSQLGRNRRRHQFGLCRTQSAKVGQSYILLSFV